MANEDMPKGELVFSIGVEGGGISVYRTPLASGGWLFHQEGGSIGLMLDDVDEGWTSWKHETVQTFQEALLSIAKGGEWIFFSPILIHPDYRIAVRQLVQETVRNLPEEQKHRWDVGVRKKWQRKLRAEPRPTDLFGNPIE